MALKRWEIQVLMLLAQEPKSPEALEVFEEYKNEFSADAKQVASQILGGAGAAKNASDRVTRSAQVFLRRGAARTAERETRELAHVS